MATTISPPGAPASVNVEVEMDKPAQNIQDSFLNTARKDKMALTIYLLSGVKLTGRIRSFDKYCLVLESGNQEQLIFKHAISTVVFQRSMLRELTERHGPHATVAPVPTVAAAGGAVLPAAAPAGPPSDS